MPVPARPVPVPALIAMLLAAPGCGIAMAEIWPKHHLAPFQMLSPWQAYGLLGVSVCVLVVAAAATLWSALRKRP
jgi:hypothetical protein